MAHSPQRLAAPRNGEHNAFLSNVRSVEHTQLVTPNHCFNFALANECATWYGVLCDAPKAMFLMNTPLTSRFSEAACPRPLQPVVRPFHLPDFLLLSSLHSIWQFAAVVFPPSCQGLMWSPSISSN